MIKVMIERQVRKGKDVLPLLRQLRGAALYQPGYITGETLVDTKDNSIIAVISTWRSLEDWQAWEASATRAKLYQQIEPLLVKKPEVRIYQIAAAEARSG